ncbi:MAG TPA: class I SAM-dependent methyltransferase [Rudaea sp.]|jgi:S-adenosylmethionine-diacylgycerolhomoserine-N-methlytransferase|nr:class I SAM-dependent methyltransferase [Rudaea sp.]
MPLLERLQNDFVVLRQLIRGMPRDVGHAQQLQAFYGPQAAHYDEFRDRLLPGRKELIQRLPLPNGAHVVELGGGTGRNLGFFGARLDQCASVDIVDLCPALLDVARARASAKSHVHVIEADATTYQPNAPVDCVYFSYALTMIPNWQAALSNAWTMLKPGGAIGVVDFCVPMQTASKNRTVKSLEGKFWKRWFAHDGVRLDPQHRMILRQLFPQNEIVEQRARVPYLPVAMVPYYRFVGRKAALV